ncbi:MAG: TraI domain-containing protein [Legionellales bacterium]|nr:TraI domain-containing protein [Legionellales bacterium]
MFHHHEKKVKVPFSKPLKDLTAITPPFQVLSEGKRQELLKSMMDNSDLETPRFEALCTGLIHNFINHCQYLPETSTSYYAESGGLLDHALHRTEAALTLFRQFVLQKEREALSEEQKLWLYALFSASILQGIGKLQTDFQVDLFDINGQVVKRWGPLLESMISVGGYYHFEFLVEGGIELRRRLTLLMARLLMPTAGYAWIISNPEVLAVWLALLSDDARGAGTLGALLIRADAIAIQRYLTDFLNKHAGNREGRQGRLSTFVDKVPDSLADKEKMMGAEFIKWLMNQLESGKIMVNKAPLLMVPGGLLMCAEMFQLFIRHHPEYKNWQLIQKGFLSLGLHRMDAEGTAMARFEQTRTHEMLHGVLVRDFAVMLPEQMTFHQMHTGEQASMSAVELVHLSQCENHDFQRVDQPLPKNALQQLSSTGAWQMVEAPKSGHKHSG